ncbi:hypothetical protein SAMN05421856_102560 [Chryseobacterium taichungense]|uniref:Uncharacterized protein n=1 Tax=Chryseobacterium taichungense TaxID=295069 RepID=A0A1H7XPW1_9FLAO|nr:hypothetical protein SAMN05421856_102560 [Chryseobacterium taichungense]
MSNFLNHLVSKPTFVSVLTALYFSYVLFLIVYKWFDPPKIGSAYKMILETLLVCSVVPLVLFIVDRLLVLKFSNIKLTVIETIILGSVFVYCLIQ